MKIPNLFIVGAARSGTTSLWHYLKSQPEVFLPADMLQKEPSYFSEVQTGLDLNKYLRIFGNADQSCKYIGDASVAYLTDPESAKRIHEFNPNAKIVIILRNPADRAYSLYRWMTQEGYEYLPSFKKALKQEEKRKSQKQSDWFRPNYYWGYQYFRSGLYFKQVKRYLHYFKSDVLIIRFEELKSEPAAVYERLCIFLGIKPVKVIFKKYNVSMPVRSPKISFILRKLNNYIVSRNKHGVPLNVIYKELKPRFSEITRKFNKRSKMGIFERIGLVMAFQKTKKYLRSVSDDFLYRDNLKKEVRDKIMEFGLKNGRPSGIDKNRKNELMKRYEEDIKKLNSLTGMSFNSWLQE